MDGHPHLVADRVEGRLLGGHTHHCVSAPLPTGPAQLEHVETSLVTHLRG